MYSTLVISVDELWLKGKNRPSYYKAISKHIKESLQLALGDRYKLKKEDHRFIVESDNLFTLETVNSLRTIPGLFAIVPAVKTEKCIDAISNVALEEISDVGEHVRTFKVRSKRSCKLFPINSMEISRRVGGAILRGRDDLKVDVHRPDLYIDIKIMKGEAYVSSKIFKGVGGLPFGTSGHLVTLLSGGFDSPVASYLMSKRGCRQTFAFFYGYPFVGEEVINKILELSKVLGRYQRHSKLYIIPFGEVQSLISKECREEYRTVLFRKSMVIAADVLADRIHADAILTGDALGQVSSQTIGNISILDTVIERPILRPLIGHNKAEIISLSREIGTHDISIVPHDDACSLFAPKHPILVPEREYVKNFGNSELNDQIKKSIEEASMFSIRVDGELTKIK